MIGTATAGKPRPVMPLVRPPAARANAIISHASEVNSTKTSAHVKGSPKIEGFIFERFYGVIVVIQQELCGHIACHYIR